MNANLKIQGVSHKPLIVKSKKHGEFRLHSILRINDVETLLELLNDKTLSPKEFTIKVLNQVVFFTPVNNLSSWTEKELLIFARRWARKALNNEAKDRDIKNFDDFKNSISHYIVKITENLGGALKDFQSSLKNLTDGMWLQINSMLSSTNNSLELIIKSFQDTLKSSISDLFTTVQQIDIESYEANNRLTLSQYELAPLIIDAREFLKFKDKRVKASITRRLYNETIDESFASYLETLFHHPLLKKRWSAIKQALTSHRNRQYFVSTPVFIAQTEGMFTDWLVLRKLAQKETGNVVYAEKPGGNKKVRLTSLRKKVDHAKTKIGDDPFIELTISTVLNRTIDIRNSILHGERSNYGTARNSTQALLLAVAFASFIESETEKES